MRLLTAEIDDLIAEITGRITAIACYDVVYRAMLAEQTDPLPVAA